MTELDEYLERHAKLSDSTKRSYKTAYNKLVRSKLFERSIITTGEDTIISHIQQITNNPNTAASLLNLCICFKKEVGKPIDSLVSYRDKLKGLIEKHTEAVHSTLVLPKYEELIDYMNSAYVKKDYLRFAVNYLLITYGVRNKDVNCIITEDRRDLVGKDNFLLLLKTRILWIRADYKTVGVYGVKEIVIRNRRFQNSLKALLAGKTKDFLLKNPSGERIADGSLGTTIQGLTLEGIGEGNICKILLEKYKGDYYQLKELSDSRGTNVDTLIERYTVNNQNVNS